MSGVRAVHAARRRPASARVRKQRKVKTRSTASSSKANRFTTAWKSIPDKRVIEARKKAQSRVRKFLEQKSSRQRISERRAKDERARIYKNLQKTFHKQRETLFAHRRKFSRIKRMSETAKQKLYHSIPILRGVVESADLTMPEPHFFFRMMGADHVVDQNTENPEARTSQQQAQQTSKALSNTAVLVSPEPNFVTDQRWFKQFQSVSTSKSLTMEDANKIVRGRSRTRARPSTAPLRRTRRVRPRTAPSRRSPQLRVPQSQRLLAFDA